MTWLYEGKPYTLPDDFTIDDYYGFVYLITNRATAKKYIGKKFFWSKKTLPKTKTRKRRKITYVESDWKSYYGSNRVLNEEREKAGDDISPKRWNSCHDQGRNRRKSEFQSYIKRQRTLCLAYPSG